MRFFITTGLCFSLLGCATGTSNVQGEKATKPIPPKAVITGRVNINGQPVKGMLVEAYSVDCFAGAVVAKTYTGAKGEFRFKHVKPQTYYIGVNDFRGGGVQLPGFSSTCGKGRYFSGKDPLHFQIPVKRR